MVKYSVNFIRKIKLYFVNQNVHGFVLQIYVIFACVFLNIFNDNFSIDKIQFKLLVFYLKQNDFNLLAKILINLLLKTHHVLEVDELYIFEEKIHVAL